MIASGLVSVTFRQLTPAEIVALAADCGLMGIEWGGDVHVPHGDVDAAQQVGAMTREAGLTIPSYGSYYRVGLPDTGPFEGVLASALALGAPLIRVWAGRIGSAEADEAHWARVVADSQRIAALAADEGVGIAYEYHGNTLTDTLPTTLALLQRVDHPNVSSYWQARGTVEAGMAALAALGPWLNHVHVQQGVGGARQALVQGEAAWLCYLAAAAAAPGDRYAMIEFVRDDDPANLPADAATLNRWLDAVNNE